MSASSTRIPYRPDVDGLRAIAVLGVVLFHAGLGVPGGYVGVDVFFVISGFLITSLILKDLRSGTFSFLEFWERRARRILPALTVVVVVVLVLGWFLLLPSDYQGLGRAVLALGFFASNILFWRETGYFSAAAEEKPLLHTWSLSVEEQFYLLIPLFLAACFRFRRVSWIGPLLIGGAAASFLLSFYTVSRMPAATFFLLPTRAWELAAGALLAFARPVLTFRLRSWMAWGGLLAILLAFFCYTEETPFPGPAALAPVAGTAFLIWSGIGSGKGPLPLKFLSARPLTWIGLLSYSWYLWHWPFFAYHRYLFSASPGPILSASFVLLSLFLAWLSLRFVERPFRRRQLLPSRQRLLVASGAAGAALLVLAAGLWRAGGFPGRVPPDAWEVAAVGEDMTFLVDMKPADIPDGMTELGERGSPEVLVWGDSHAMALLPGIDAACREMGIGGRAATSAATVPVLDWYYVNRHGLSEEAPAYNQAVMEFVETYAGEGTLRLVVLAARWRGYLEEPRHHQPLEQALLATVQRIRDAGCEVVIVREVPNFPREVPRSLILSTMMGWESLKPVLEANLHTEQSLVQDRLFERILDQVDDGVSVLDPLPFLFQSGEYIDPVDSSGIPLYRDDNHLSVPGSLRLQAAFSGLFDSSE